MPEVGISLSKNSFLKTNLKIRIYSKDASVETALALGSFDTVVLWKGLGYQKLAVDDGRKCSTATDLRTPPLLPAPTVEG